MSPTAHPHLSFHEQITQLRVRRYEDNQRKWEHHLRKTIVHVGDLDDYRVFFGSAKLGNINDIRRLLNKGFDPPPLLSI
jgi:hypothetical protein